MFNTTNITLGRTSNSVTFNTPATGMIQRSHSCSRFIRFQKGSKFEEFIFPDTDVSPQLKKYTRGVWETIGEITVLQVLIFGDNQYLCEIVFNKDLIETP